MKRLLLLTSLIASALGASAQTTTQSFSAVVTGVENGGLLGAQTGDTITGSLVFDTDDFSASAPYAGPDGNGGIQYLAKQLNGIPAPNLTALQVTGPSGSSINSNGPLYVDFDPSSQRLALSTLDFQLSCGSGTTALQPFTIPVGCKGSIEVTNGGGLLNITIITPPVAPTAELIDPVSSGFVISYSGGSTINTDTDLLASGGTSVVGAAADGVTQMLIRIPATQVGQQFTLTLLDETGAAGTVAADGGLVPLGASPVTSAVRTARTNTASTGPASSLPVTAVSTSQGPMAFAIYESPIDFARGTSDDSAVTRNLNLQVLLAGGAPSTTPFVLVRPPVVLVHGLWASPDSWATFTSFTNDPLKRFFFSKANYSRKLTNVQSITPTSLDFTPGSTPINTNALGFVYNAQTVEAQIQAAVNDYRNSQNVTVSQADVIGHSMGGVVTRSIALLSSDDTAGVNLVHKLITIGTPHLGSPLAIKLLSGNSSCSRRILASQDNPSFSFVSIGGSPGAVTYVPGAVSDLSGNGDGTGFITDSPLDKLYGLPLSFPIAYIAGTSRVANWAALGGVNISGAIEKLCPLFIGPDEIASALSTSLWGTLFSGAENDSIVPLNSQLNGTTAASDLQFPGLIHSAGLEALDFLPPTELDHSAGIDSKVIDLLNAPIAGNYFHPKGSRQ